MYDDLIALLNGDAPAPRDRAAALSDVLRRQQAQAQAQQPAREDALGQLAMLSGDPVLGRYGAVKQQEAEQRRALERTMAAESRRQAQAAAEHARESAEWDRRNAVTSPQADKRALMMAGVNVANQRGLAEYRNTLELDQKAKEAALKAQEGIPPEYEAIGHPTEVQKNKFATGVASAEKLKAMAGQLRTMVGEAGGLDRVMGPKRKAMDTLLRQLQIEGKNVAELGALSGPDFALMQEIIQDPNSFSSLLFNMGTKGLDQVENWANTQVAGALKAYGIRKRQPKRELVPAKSKGLAGKHLTQDENGDWVVDDGT